MQSFIDLFNRKITLTKERLNHILERVEMLNQDTRIKETLSKPELIKKSISDKNVVIYYKYYLTTPVTSKHLAVIVKSENKESFIISAYFTDRIKKGETVWKES